MQLADDAPLFPESKPNPWPFALHVLLPLAVGFAVYATVRPSFALLAPARIEPDSVLALVVYNGPDAAWAYALTALLGLTWTETSPARQVWLLAALALGVGLEVGQRAHLLPGTFDPLDLIVIVAAWLAAVVVTAPRRRNT